MTKIARLCARLSIALALGVMTLSVLDERNPVMGFLTSNSSKVFIMLAGIMAIASGIIILRADRRAQESNAEKESSKE